LPNALDRSESLLYLGRVEADLHRPDLARKNAVKAQQLLNELVKRNSQNRYYLEALEEAQGASGSSRMIWRHSLSTSPGFGSPSQGQNHFRFRVPGRQSESY
jgi:hypothetical protein